MAFITQSDFDEAINNNILDDIVESDNTKVDRAITESINYMKGFLSARYDIAAIFAATGTNRDPTILTHGINIALYRLHRLINPRKIPQHRVDMYNDAKEWFTDVNKGIINPPDLPKPTTGEKDYILFGSNTKRDNQY